MTELQEIRNELGMTRPMFCKLVIHKSKSMLIYYETQQWNVPKEVMVKAEEWLKFKRDFEKKWKKK